jgi:hypothetical protein
MDLQVVEPHEDSSLKLWWAATRDRVHKKDMKRFDTLVILMAWTLWKQSNARAFGNAHRQLSLVQIIEKITEEFKLWDSARESDHAARIG